MYLYLLCHTDQYVPMLGNVDIIAKSLQTTLPNMEGTSNDSKANAVEGHEKKFSQVFFSN
jgi:hypothetical protein